MTSLVRIILVAVFAVVSSSALPVGPSAEVRAAGKFVRSAKFGQAAVSAAAPVYEQLYEPPPPQSTLLSFPTNRLQAAAAPPPPVTDFSGSNVGPIQFPSSPNDNNRRALPTALRNIST